MDFHGIELVCPACGGGLARNVTGDGERLLCDGCGRSFPVVLDIPDLRLWPDPYISMEDDRGKGRMLAKACAGLGFAESVELYYSLTTRVPPFQARRFTRGLLAAVARSRDALDRWESGCASPGGALLEIGCGTAPLLRTAAERYALVAGVDVAFRWLVLARKRLEEAGVSGVPLVCACAEALPFPSGAFDRVAADSALETLRDQDAALRECFRVTRPGARLFFATPNRSSLGPDPHAGVPAGGLLPERWIAAYVRRKGGIPPRRRLLSAGDARCLLRRHGFEPVHIYVPRIPAEQWNGFGRGGRLLIDFYNLVSRTPPGRAALLRFGPLFHGVAARAEHSGNAQTPRERDGSARPLPASG